MLEIINESASGSGATKVKTPMILENDYRAAFALDLMLKDLSLAKEAGVDYPIGKTVAESFLTAHDKGFGADDVTGIINYLKGL